MTDKQPTKTQKIANKTIITGLIVCAIFITIFIIWGVLAPINSASIANGQIVLDFNRKTISHLEGGIIEKILVQEGQYVLANQPLITLKDIQIDSQSKMLKKQLISSLAIEKRLIAQRDNNPQANFNEIINNYNDIPYTAKIINNQRNLLINKIQGDNNKTAILNKKIAGINIEIKGIKSQQQAITTELKILNEQKQISTKLIENNNFPISKLLEIKKQIAISTGRKAALSTETGKAKQAIAQTELEIINLKNESLKETLSELQKIEIAISDLNEQLISTADILKRTTIKSPVSGVVTDIKYHTIGSVISPASNIMYIVPKDDELIIEARVNPNDIDNIENSQDAKVQLSAFKAKKVPKINAKVISVSADILLDETTGEQYFLARIRINAGEIEKLQTKITLYPGMPAQVFIINGSRNLFDYLFTPITDASYRAFREE